MHNQVQASRFKQKLSISLLHPSIFLSPMYTHEMFRYGEKKETVEKVCFLTFIMHTNKIRSNFSTARRLLHARVQYSFLCQSTIELSNIMFVFSAICCDMEWMLHGYVNIARSRRDKQKHYKCYIVEVHPVLAWYFAQLLNSLFKSQWLYLVINACLHSITLPEGLENIIWTPSLRGVTR